MNLLSQIEYEKMSQKENFYWWFLGRRYILSSILERYIKKEKSKNILDVGCGSGGNINFLSEFGLVTGLDPSSQAIGLAKDKGFKELIIGEIENADFKNESFDLVTAFDVLEHLDKDALVIKEMARISKNLVMVSVPAFSFLWNPQDKYLDHKRRYTKKTLVTLFESAGLKVLESSYFVMSAVPAILLRRFIENIFHSKSKSHTFDIILPSPLNYFFVLLLKIESLLLKFFSLPFGSSVYLIAKKDN